MSNVYHMHTKRYSNNLKYKIQMRVCLMFAVLGHLGPLEVPSRFIHGYTEDLISLSLAVFAARSLTNPNHIFIYFLRREVSKKKKRCALVQCQCCFTWSFHSWALSNGKDQCLHATHVTCNTSQREKRQHGSAWFLMQRQLGKLSS